MISNTQIQKLKVLLKEHIATLEGAFVNKNAGYEIAICKNFGFKEQTNRYWDCLYEEENLFIEFKKGTSIWLDLVRYSEILLKKNYDAVKCGLKVHHLCSQKCTSNLINNS